MGVDGGEPVFFADAAAFRAWLAQHHDTATELWMVRRRKAHPEPGLLWEDAVAEALCFGWIDSTSRRLDDEARIQRWTPRKPASTWSAVNVALVEKLTAEGRMHPAGLAAFARRRPERTAIYSYETSDELDADERAALAAVAAAQAFWDAATPGYRRICAHWVHGAQRAQTRSARLTQLVAECAAGRLIPSQRYGTPPAWLTRAAAAAAAAASDGGEES